MITTTTTLPAPVQQTFDDVLLSVRTPNLIMKLGALSKRLPAKGGRTLRMARYDRLPTAPVPLGPSGATPPATPLNRVDIDATMSFYGLYVAINQQVTLQNQDPVLNETAELLGLSLRMTEDQLTRDMLASTAPGELKEAYSRFKHRIDLAILTDGGIKLKGAHDASYFKKIINEYFGWDIGRYLNSNTGTDSWKYIFDSLKLNSFIFLIYDGKYRKRPKTVLASKK